MKTGIVLVAALAGVLAAQEAPAPPNPPAQQSSEEQRREQQLRRMRDAQRKIDEAQRRAQRKMADAQRRIHDAAQKMEDAQLLGAPRFPFMQGGGSYLGIGVADVDSERAKALKLTDEHGVEVKNITPDSPAATAGLKEGDVILEYNGERVEGTEQLMRMVRETPPGRHVRLQVWRGGSAQAVGVTMGKRSGPMFLRGGEQGFPFANPQIAPFPPMPDMPRPNMSWRSPMLGVETESLNSQLAQYFGVKEGVLVRSVVKGSAAEKAGIKAGDVILKVDGTAVTSPREITGVLRSARGAKRTVPVVISRERRESTVNVTLEEGDGAAQPVRRIRASGGLPSSASV